jgi:SAM-dependent methyltransferase/DNA-directed RNA polymerase subunit RPC12/RpoP
MDSLRVLCPHCKQVIDLTNRKAICCPRCQRAIQYLHDVPVLRNVPEGEQIDFLEEAHRLPRMDSSKLTIPLVQEALSSTQLVLELGAGIDNCSHRRLIKTDAYMYSADLDYLVDAHSLPFADNAFGYVFSLAVFEHLHSPWVVVDEIFRVLKPGGKVYVLCAFMQHLHGYPHHYFNMTESGLRQLFHRFVTVKCGPSAHCSFKEISVILQDVLCMVIKIKPHNRKRIFKLIQLLTGLKLCIKHLSAFDTELKSDLSDYDAWRRIAPAIELEATKP